MQAFVCECRMHLSVRCQPDAERAAEVAQEVGNVQRRCETVALRLLQQLRPWHAEVRRRLACSKQGIVMILKPGQGLSTSTACGSGAGVAC